MFIPTAVALAAAFWTIVLVVLAVEKHLFDPALRLWKSLSRFNKCVVAAILFGALAFAGPKPLPGGGGGGDDPSGTNVVEGEAEVKVRGEGEQWNLSTCFADQQKKESNILCSPSPLTFTSTLLSPLTFTSTLPAPLSLGAVGRGESFDFFAPEGAVVATNWLMHGATTGRIRVSPCDWEFPFGTNVVRNFAAFADGRLEPWPGGDAVTLAPMVASLGIVPAANWSLLAPTNRPSLFWWAMRGNALVCTWQNVLLGRETDCPVSFQAELRATGGVTYRYDLGRLASDDPLTNAVVLARSGQETASPFSDSPLSRDLTSLTFRSADEAACDEFAASFAAVMGDSDPFACPPGSTNTIFEHVFYTGTTNAPFAYPSDTADTVVLVVTVTGVGSGELRIGDRVVPLLARPRPRLLMGANGAPDPTATTLRVPVPKDRTHRLYLRGDSTLSLSLDSDDFAFGVLPDLSGRHCRGWINFPYTEASHPCIHSFMEHETEVTLPVGEGADDLTCTWNETDDVEVWNRPPRSARIAGRFDPRDERPVTYTLSHPRYLFGRTEYEQNVRYCPKPSDDDPTDYYDEEVLYPDECWCCHWQTCDTNCTCGCSLCGDWTDTLTNDCEFASTNYPHLQGVLKIRTPREYSTSVALSVPTGVRNCCPCPEHHTNGVSLVYARRVSVVDPSDSAFRSSDKPVTVRVAATEPSYEPGDGRALFATNGVPMESHDYTCLGVGISGAYGVDLAVLNAKSESFGYPFTVSTNLNADTHLILDTKVLLPSGRVTLSVEDATAPIEVWAIDASSWAWRKLADANGLSLDMSMAEWRRLAGYEKSPDAPRVGICLLSPTAGQATLVLHYWNVIGNKFVEDEARQRVTAVTPPLLADVNHDGKIGDADAALQTAGAPFRFWYNEDTAKGDFSGQMDSTTMNGSDRTVNGKYDLVNLFPIRIDVSEFASRWRGSVGFRLRSGSWWLRFCVLADLSPEDITAMQTETIHTDCGEVLEMASLSDLGSSGTNLTSVLTAQNGDIVLAFEARDAVSEWSAPELVVSLDGRDILSYRIPLSITSVDSMYRYLNLRGAESNPQFEPVIPGIPSNCPDGETDQTNYIFVHGYNVNALQSRDWARTIFKRLWWAGSRSKFTAVDWCGDESQIYVPTQGDVSPNYYINVEHAFMTAEALMNACALLPGNKVMLAHSLGNMLVSAAAKDFNLQYDMYYMLNAAVPMEAYDENAHNDLMVDGAWKDIDESFRASHFSDLFVDEVSDFRVGLSWRGRFAGIRNAVNCYSTTEDVLANPSEIKACGLTIGETTGDAWSRQELFKGCSLWYGVNSITFSGTRIEGGWGINDSYAANPLAYIPLSGFNAFYFRNFSRDDKVVSPLYTSFTDGRMHTTNALNLVDYQLRAKMLGDAISAESFAVGANEAGGLTANYNCQGQTPNGWPSERQERRGNTMVDTWLHSDIKNVAFYYVYKLFEKITKGE